MSNENSERDTHFQEFAELLANDLAALNSRQWNSLDEYIAAKRLLIAQRAYDLAYHILDYVDLDQDFYGRPEFEYERPKIIKSIPDMTEWPDTSS